VADVAARRMSLFKEKLVKALDDESPAYLQLVEELAVETGRDMAEIAAVAARLAHGDKTPVAEKESAEKNEDDADMVHVVIGAGRRIGVRPNDVVGAIANEARIPGKVIGAIDIQDHCTFVEVPAEYERQVLAGLSGLTIRGREIGVRLATEQDLWSRGPKRRNDDGRRGAAPRGHAAKRKKYGRS
jgi:ATP-dependent RNA helicase DeaD